MIDTAFIEFIKDIEKARKKLGCSEKGAFYRGHSHSSHKLIPSMIRTDFVTEEDKFIEMEHNLYVESYARAKHLIKSSESSWERLSIMQHFGIPTRLLDWSESFAVALFFALSGETNNPVIWLVNPFKLNKENKVSNEPRILTVGIDNVPDYENCFITFKSEWQFNTPVLLQIPWSDERIINQKGFFFFHNTSVPMEESCKKFVCCVPINEDAIEGAKKFLEYSGINEDVVFPGLDGFGRFIKKRYKA